MYAIDRDFAKDVIWNGLGKVATGPSASTIKFYTDDVPKYPLRSGQGQGAAEGSRLQGREDPPAAAALWRDLAALGRGREAEPAWTSASTSRRSPPTCPAGNQKIGDWDYDIAFTYLYQYGDPALGVGAQLRLQRRSPRASRSTTSRATPTRRSTSCSPTARSRRRIPSARSSTRRRRRSWSRTCRWPGCSSCSSRPSPAARSRT